MFLQKGQVTIPSNCQYFGNYFENFFYTTDTYGTHLDSNGVTVDFDKEKAYLRKAGESLAEILYEITIDDFPVSA